MRLQISGRFSRADHSRMVLTGRKVAAACPRAVWSDALRSSRARGWLASPNRLVYARVSLELY